MDRKLQIENCKLQIVNWLRDILLGLFSLSTKRAPAGCDYRRVLEDRYSKPRRCC